MKIKEVSSIFDTFQFVRCFQKVFAGKPYNEKWSFFEVLTERKFLKESSGKIFGYYGNSGNLIGFVTYRDMIRGENSLQYSSSENVGYISDIAVLKEYRNLGIGSELFSYCLKQMKENGYTIAVMRTLEKGKSMSYNIAVRHGMTEIENAHSIVFKERTDNNRQNFDVRIFLDKRL